MDNEDFSNSDADRVVSSEDNIPHFQIRRPYKIKYAVGIFFLLLVTASTIAVVGNINKKQNTKPKAQSNASVLSRNTPGDYWADIVLGQTDFSQTSEWTTVPDKVWLPNGVIIDRTSSPNKLYVWDAGNNRILGFKIQNGDCQTRGSNGRCQPDLIIGQPNGNSASCNTDSAYQNHPQRAPASNQTLCGLEEKEKSPGEGGSAVSMDTDNNGNLYVPDIHNNRVLKFYRPFETDNIADDVWGQSNFSGNLENKGNSQPDNTSLRFEPYNNCGAGVDLDDEGFLWVADDMNNRVLRFPPDSKIADLVLGQPNFSSFNANNNLSNTNAFECPAAVRVKGIGADKTIYVADKKNKRILMFKAPFSNNMTGTVFGSGFSQPSGIEIDPDGQGIWINDTREAGKGLIELWNLEGTEVKKIIGGPKYIPYAPNSTEYNNFGNSHFQENFGSLGIDSQGNICTATRQGHDKLQNNLLCFKGPFDPVTDRDPDVNFFSPPNGGNLTTRKGMGSGRNVTVADNQLIANDLGRILY